MPLYIENEKTKMAFNFNLFRNPALRDAMQKLYAALFSTTDGHDHDGVNSKTLSPAAVVENNAINAAKIQDNAVITRTILDANVTANKLASNAVTTAKITDANVTADKLAANAVTTAKILNANVTADKLAADSVITAKILNANVTADKLAANAVTTAKIADANVTEAKLHADVAEKLNRVADNVPETTEAVSPTSDEFNALINALIDAGLMAAE